MKYDQWNPWTEKSSTIYFKATQNKDSVTGEGDGERKLGKEYDVKPNGQNIPYDLDINNKKFEVKKLDKGTFNTGKEARIYINKYKDSIKKCIKQAKTVLNYIEREKLIKNLQEFNKIQEHIKKFTDYGELSESKCKNSGELQTIIDYIINILDTEFIQKQKNNTILKYDINGNKKIYTIKEYIERALMDDISKQEINETINSNLDYYIFPKQIDCELFHNLDKWSQIKNVLFYEIFNNKIDVFVFVDKQKGYYPIKIEENINTKIQFCRITKGCPRFKVISDLTNDEFTQADLKSMKKTELQKIAKKLDIPTKETKTNKKGMKDRTKTDLIKEILTKS
jgi:hypothetical protein